MTRFAFGAKCGTPARPPVFGSRGSMAAANALRSGPRRAASAPMPIPCAERPKNCRRVRWRSISCLQVIGLLLLLRYDLVQVQNHARDGCIRGQLGGIEARIAPGLAYGKQLQRSGAILSVRLDPRVEQGAQHLQFLPGRRARRGKTECVPNPRIWIVRRFEKRTLCEYT